MTQHVEGLWDRRLAGAADERLFAGRGRTTPDRPNIVFILADDLGWGDLGCFGSLHIRTPNLDRLAAQGVRFTHAYAASPWCSPTRVALYTGRYPNRLPVGLEEPLRTRDEHSGIPADHPTLPSILSAAGYDTAMFGKWHCGWLPWFSPLRIGFGEFFGNLDGAMDYLSHIGTLGEPDLYEGETLVDEVGYYTDLVSQRTCDFIRRAHDNAFYAQVNYTAPHWPWEGRDDHDVSARIVAEFREGRGIMSMVHLDGGSLAKYGELVETMDEGVGTILDALDEAGVAENTIVLFASDNGGERYSFMWPFLGEKGDLNEGGIRVPFMLRWPAAIDAGQWSDAPTITMDWTATLVSAGGASAAPGHPFDGVDLLPWLTGTAAYPAHDLYWRTASQEALRRGPFKLLVNHRERGVIGDWPRVLLESPQLFDVTGDGRERADLARAEPDVVDELRTAWLAIDAELLPVPADHPSLPRRASAGLPAISKPD